MKKLFNTEFINSKTNDVVSCLAYVHINNTVAKVEREQKFLLSVYCNLEKYVKKISHSDSFDVSLN